MPKYFISYAYIDEQRPEMFMLGNTVMDMRFPISGVASLRAFEDRIKDSIEVELVTITNFIQLGEENAGDQMF